MFNHPYICLSTKPDLDDQKLLKWFGVVSESAPSGVISAVELRADNKPQRFYHRKIDGMNRYCVVLSRDLEGEEVNKIAQAANQEIPEGDWEISWSQHPQTSPIFEEVREDILKTIILEAAKRNHGKWLNRKINEGWRYAQSFNSRKKVSPMCREWDALSERYQRAEYHRMKTLLEVLDEMKLHLATKKV
jgi:hypothetical protein